MHVIRNSLCYFGGTLCILGSARLKIIVEHTFLGKRGREKRKEERANLLLSLPPPPTPPEM